MSLLAELLPLIDKETLDLAVANCRAKGVDVDHPQPRFLRRVRTRRKAALDVPGIAYLYARVSADRDENVSPEDQFFACLDYYERTLKPKGTVLCQDRFIDSAVSGGVPLLNRAHFTALYKRLKPGDHVIFYDYMRFGRDAFDTMGMRRYFDHKQVRLHFTNIGVIEDNSTGEMMLNQFANFGQWYRSTCAERMRVSKARGRAEGRRIGLEAPWGCKWVGRGKNAVMRPNPKQRGTAQHALRLADKGYTQRRISDMISADMAAIHGETFNPDSAFSKRRMSLQTVQSYMAHERKLQEAERAAGVPTVQYAYPACISGNPLATSV